MLSISGETSTYRLDLNEFPYETNTLEIVSENDGFPLSFGVKYISNPSVNSFVNGTNELVVSVDLEVLKEKCWICLANTNNETFMIEVVPNHEMSREKHYTFKLGKTSVEEGVAVINVISKESGKYHPWSITLDGKPLPYEITRAKTKMTAKLKMKLESDFNAKFVLTQEKSEKEIVFFLQHKVDGTLTIEEKE